MYVYALWLKQNYTEMCVVGGQVLTVNSSSRIAPWSECGCALFGASCRVSSLRLALSARATYSYFSYRLKSSQVHLNFSHSTHEFLIYLLHIHIYIFAHIYICIHIYIFMGSLTLPSGSGKLKVFSNSWQHSSKITCSCSLLKLVILKWFYNSIKYFKLKYLKGDKHTQKISLALSFI